jgi:hypothetical protein
MSAIKKSPKDTVVLCLMDENGKLKGVAGAQPNSKPDYREGLEKELSALRESEMWRTGAVVRQLRPENNG